MTRLSIDTSSVLICPAQSSPDWPWYAGEIHTAKVPANRVVVAEGENRL